MGTFDRFLYIYNFIRPILDISILTYILYKAYDFISKTNSVQILKSAVIIAVGYAIAFILDLKTLSWLLNIITPGLVIAFAVIFQPEIRKLFLRMGQNRWFAFGQRAKNTYIDKVLDAAEVLSKQKRGMLAVFLRETKMDNIVATGEALNADITSSLLVTIFASNTPLHDGACFIDGQKLIAAGCFLPLSEDYNIKKTFGTRHRAGLGLSEVSDAVVLIVSEETGALSLAHDAKLNYDLSREEIEVILENLLQVNPSGIKEEDNDEQSS